jgi:hypothetical protein
VPVIAVTPRSGPPLRRSTLARFDAMKVQYVRKTLTEQYAWYAFLNKPLALVIAEEVAKTDIMVWLDSDIFITGAPEAFDLEPEVDFAACPSDRNLGSTGPSDKFEAYWSRMCDVHGIPLETLPWVKTCREDARIRIYFNGGVLAYRRASGYAPAYLAGCMDALNARVRSNDAGLFFAEQVTAGLIAFREGLKLGLLAEPFNYAVGSKCDGFSQEAFKQACVLHYHDSLWPHFFPKFLELCREGQPKIYEWLKGRSPLKNDAPLGYRLWGKALKSGRSRQERAFEKTCERC